MVFSSTLLNHLYKSKNYTRIDELFSSGSSDKNPASIGKFISATAYHLYNTDFPDSDSEHLSALVNHVSECFRILTSSSSLDAESANKHVKSAYYVAHDRLLKDARWTDLLEFLRSFVHFTDRYGDQIDGDPSPHCKFGINVVNQTLSNPDEDFKDELWDLILRIVTKVTMKSTKEAALVRGWIQFWTLDRHRRLQLLNDVNNDSNNNNNDGYNTEEEPNPYVDRKISAKFESEWIQSLKDCFQSFQFGLSVTSCSDINAWFSIKRILRTIHILANYFRISEMILPAKDALELVIRWSARYKIYDLESVALADLVKLDPTNKKSAERIREMLTNTSEVENQKLRLDQGILLLACARSLVSRGQELYALEMCGRLLRLTDSERTSFYLLLSETNLLIGQIQNSISRHLNSVTYPVKDKPPSWTGGCKDIAEAKPMHFASEAFKYVSCSVAQLSQSNIYDTAIQLHATRTYNQYLEVVRFRYQIFDDISAGLEAKLYAKFYFQKAKEWGFPLRVCEGLLNLVDIDLTCDNEREAQTKLEGVKIILSSLESVTQDDKKASSRRNVRSQNKLEATKVNENPGSSPLLTKSAFKIPSWSSADHPPSCSCYVCEQPMCSYLCIRYIGLQAVTYYLSGELEMAEQYFNGLDLAEKKLTSKLEGSLEISRFIHDVFQMNRWRVECLAQDGDIEACKAILASQKERVRKIDTTEFPDAKNAYLDQNCCVEFHENAITNEIENEEDSLSFRVQTRLRLDVESTPLREIRDTRTSAMNAPMKKPVPISFDVHEEGTKETRKYLSPDLSEIRRPLPPRSCRRDAEKKSTEQSSRIPVKSGRPKTYSRKALARL